MYLLVLCLYLSSSPCTTFSLSSSSTTPLSITFKLSDNTTPVNSALHNSYCHYNSAIIILLHVLIAFHIRSTVLLIRMGS